MKTYQVALVLLLATLTPFGRCFAQATAPIAYQIVDLGTLGGKNCTANALNNSGQVVGVSQTTSGMTHAFLWEHGQMHDLGVLPGDKGSAAFALNDKGQVVGLSDSTFFPSIGSYGGLNDYGMRAVIWNNGIIKKLPVSTGSKAVGIDRAGNIAGTIPDEEAPAAFLLQGDKVTSLNGPGSYYQAAAISEAEVIGTFFTARDKSGAIYNKAFLWTEGRMHDLGLVDVNSVNAFNQQGQVVGMATFDPSLPERKQHLEAFVWKAGKVRFLGRLPDSHLNSAACGINNQGSIVGWSHTKAGDAEAVLWQGGQIINLNLCTPVPHGWMLDGAQAINDQGQILCRGYTFTGHPKGGSYVLTQGSEIPGMVQHSFLLTPTKP